MAMNRLAQNAVQNPASLNPPTSAETSCSISALMTRTNKPSVRSVSGKVSTSSRGRSTALAKPRSRAEMSSDERLEKRMPSKTRLATQSENAVMPQWMKN